MRSTDHALGGHVSAASAVENLDRVIAIIGDYDSIVCGVGGNAHGPIEAGTVALDDPQRWDVALGIGGEDGDRGRLKFSFLSGLVHRLVPGTAAACVVHQAAEVAVIGHGNLAVELVPVHSMRIGESRLKAANYA